MTVIGARDIEAASGAITVAPGDVVTPLARERAVDLGVQLHFPPTNSATSASASPWASRSAALSPKAPDGKGRASGPVRGDVTPVSLKSGPRTVDSVTMNTLYRRGAPVATPLAPSLALSPGGGKPRAAVIGAGHVGSIATLRLAESDLFTEVVLVDVVDGLAAGVALDLWHSAGLASFGTTITGTTSMSDLSGVDYVIVTAGKARKPGMTRTDLTQVNAEIVGPIADAIAAHAPQSVIVVVTNPLEEMTHLAQLRSKFPPSRVLGMAGVLDSARFAALVGLTGICRPDEVLAYALGSHGPEMVIPLSQATALGRPLTELLDYDTLRAITDRARDSGAEVVSLLKTGSAYFAPGQSAARMVTAMASSSSEIMPCAVVPDGEYGLRDTRVGLPVRLGPGGLAEIVMLELDAEEQAALHTAADSLSKRIHEVS
jgi:malate dehydrogenase